MALKLANNAVSALASAINSSSLSIALAPGDGAKFPSLAAGDWFPVTVVKSTGALEIMRCTARAGDTLTVMRAQEGTAALDFAAGDRVELRLTSGSMDQFVRKTGDTMAGPLDMGGNKITNGAQPTADSDYATKAYVDAGPGGGAFGWRNRIINGACTVRQRPGSNVIIGSNANGYGPIDRYFSSIGGGIAPSVTQIGASSFTLPGERYALCVALSTLRGETDLSGGRWIYGFNQIIEGLNCYDLAGKPVTVSFWWQSNVTGAFAFSLRNKGSTRSFVQTFNYTTANVPQYVVIKVPALPSGFLINPDNDVGMFVSIGSLNTGTYQCPSGAVGTWQSSNYISAPGIVNWCSGPNNFIRMSELQLEQGTEATQFERRSIAAETLLCQRYFEAIVPKLFYISSLSGASAAYDSMRFEVAKRATPVMSNTGLNYFSSGIGTAYNPAQVYPNPQGFSWTITGATNWQGWSDSGTWYADADF